MKLTTKQKMRHIDLHVGRDGAWLELKTKSGKHFVFQPIQTFGPNDHFRDTVLEWAKDVQAFHSSNASALAEGTPDSQEQVVGGKDQP
jgi:hypothetical protein